mmetsp:Transcript_22205/g.19034  ORF Transcript_22205/g.19034 Transcript_22205/m.19034 type:complete len:160 (+) Transcript_22205:2119-2598(+)
MSNLTSTAFFKDKPDSGSNLPVRTLLTGYASSKVCQNRIDDRIISKLNPLVKGKNLPFNSPRMKDFNERVADEEVKANKIVGNLTKSSKNSTAASYSLSTGPQQHQIPFGKTSPEIKIHHAKANSGHKNNLDESELNLSVASEGHTQAIVYQENYSTII